MDWQLVGVLVELLAAAAIIAALVFLAIQVRRNTAQEAATASALRRMAAASGATQWSQLRMLLIENEELAKLFGRGLAGDPEFSEEQQDRFDGMMGEFLNAAFAQWDCGHLGGHYSTRLKPMVAELIKSPGGSAYWARTKSSFAEAFVAAMEQ